MVLFEGMAIACNLLTFIGRLIFMSTLTISLLLFEGMKLTMVVLSAIYSYFNVFLCGFALFMIDAWSVSTPMVAEAVVQLGSFFEFIFCAALDYIVMVWTSPSSVNFRENSISMVQDGIGAAISVAWQKPLFSVQVALSTIWIVLFVNYRKLLVQLFYKFGRSCKNRLDRGLRKGLQIMRGAGTLLLYPFRKIADLYTLLGQRCGELWHPGRLAAPVAFEPVAERVDDRITPDLDERSTSKFRNQRRSKSSDKDYATLIRELRTQLEDERLFKLCVICHSNERSHMCAPCNHVSLCSECVALLPSEVRTCPICRTECRSIVKVFL